MWEAQRWLIPDLADDSYDLKHVILLPFSWGFSSSIIDRIIVPTHKKIVPTHKKIDRINEIIKIVGNSCWKDLRAWYSHSLLLCGNIWPTQIRSFNDCWAKCNLLGWRSCPRLPLGYSSAFRTWWLNHLSQCWTYISFLVADRYHCSAPFPVNLANNSMLEKSHGISWRKSHRISWR